MALTVKNLGSKALIVKLHQGSGPTMHKKDKSESVRLNSRKGAKQDVASVTKRLFGKSQTAKVVSSYGALKKYFNAHTMPWDDNGERLLPAEKFFDFMQEVRVLLNDIEDSEKEFLDEYEMNVHRRRQEIGDFNVEFPTREKIQRRFYNEVKTKPIPEFNDDIRDFNVGDVVDQLDEEVNQRVQSTLTDSFQRLHDVVGHMATRLREYDIAKQQGKKRIRLHDSILGNIAELTNILPGLNITGDRDLDNMVKGIQEMIGDYDTDDLRKYPTIRKDAIVEAEKMVSAMDAFI